VHPLAVLVVFVAQRLLWVAVLALALWLAATLAARIALRPDPASWTLPVVDAPGSAAQEARRRGPDQGHDHDGRCMVGRLDQQGTAGK
jgi:hypothetical protein